MSSIRSRWTVIACAAGLVVSAAGGAAVAARADVPVTSLGIYTLTGDATGFVAYEDEPSANAHPEGQMSAPESSSILSNGPVGYSLSSVGWPGATEGNAGGVVILLFPPAAVTQVVPIPDALTQAVDANASAIDYPIRAEARVPSQHTDSWFSLPGGALSAHADANRVEGIADVGQMAQPGAFSVGGARTDSMSTLKGSTGQDTATSVVTNVDIGGVVKIGSVSSTATAKTDGRKASGSGSTIVTGLSIGGIPATIDENGLHIGGQDVPANAALDQAASAALSGAGMQILVSQPLLTKKGASASYTAGSVFIEWTVPGDPSANVFVISLGGARVSVSGALTTGFGQSGLPGLSAPVPPIGDAAGPPGAAPATTANSTPAGSPAPGALPPLPSTATLPARTTSGSSASSHSDPGAAPTSLSGLALARTFGGFGLGWIVLGLGAVALLFAGTRRLADDLLGRPSDRCPFEETEPR